MYKAAIIGFVIGTLIGVGVVLTAPVVAPHMVVGGGCVGAGLGVAVCMGVYLMATN